VSYILTRESEAAGPDQGRGDQDHPRSYGCWQGMRKWLGWQVHDREVEKELLAVIG
jgi:hypothetical protein